MGTFLLNKVLKKSKFSKRFINVSWSPNQIFFAEFFFRKVSTNFRQWKMTLKLRILRSLMRLFIILVSLTRWLFSEEMFIFNRCISGLMSNLIKKSWTVSTSKRLHFAYRLGLDLVEYKTKCNQKLVWKEFFLILEKHYSSIKSQFFKSSFGKRVGT